MRGDPIETGAQTIQRDIGGSPRYMGTVLTMEQGALLHPQLPIPVPDYSLPSEHDFNDQYSTHGHHSSYSVGGAVDDRRHGSVSHQPSGSFSFPPTNHSHGARFVPDRGVASDTSSSTYHTTNHFAESSGGSISTSPSSAASSLAYTNGVNYPGNHYTSISSIPHAVQLPQSFVPSSYASTRVASIPDGSIPCMLPPPQRSEFATTPVISDREAYATTATPSLARTQLSSGTHSAYGAYPDTPRSSFTGVPSPAFPSYGNHMASTGGYGTTPSESSGFPWPSLEVLTDLTCEGQQVTPEIIAKVEKGFFPSSADNKWTCYRRNYFSVVCHFELHTCINNGRLWLKRHNSTAQEQVQAMGVRLSAAVDGTSGKSIELIQHTPKRDNGPKTKIEITKLSPAPVNGRNEHTLSSSGVYTVPLGTFHPTGVTPGPYLPLQHSGEANGSSSIHPANSQVSPSFSYSSVSHLPAPGQQTTHTFERVQFKQATANNGKRRASQQYFHLIVELFADVRKEGSETASWVKVAKRVSEKIVVRGRSPSHYQNEGQNGQSGRGSASGGSSYSSGGGGYGGMNAGGFRSSAGSYGGAMGGSGGYRSHQYGMRPGSDGSGSSPGSADEGAAETEHHGDAIMSDAERAGIQDYEGYQYYPSTIYEGVPQQQMLPPLTKVDSTPRWSTEPRQYAVKAEYADAVPGNAWQTGACSRFQGVESSRGYFPDLSTGYN